MTTLSDRHKVFIDALRRMLKAVESELNSVTVEFPSALKPEELDRPMLARFLAFLLRDVVLKHCGVLSLGAFPDGNRSSLSCTINGETQDMPRPPWRVAAALIDELSIAAGLSEESMSGQILLELNDGDIVLQIDKKKEAGVVSVSISQIRRESK